MPTWFFVALILLAIVGCVLALVKKQWEWVAGSVIVLCIVLALSAAGVGRL